MNLKTNFKYIFLILWLSCKTFGDDSETSELNMWINLMNSFEKIQSDQKEIRTMIEKQMESDALPIYANDCSNFNYHYCENNKCLIKNSIYGMEPFWVSCDHEIAGAGWTVIQRRINGSEDFYRSWQDYKNGFGSIEGEFWIGLDKLHALTAAQPMELYINLKKFNDNAKFAKYNLFIIGGESEKYKIREVGSYSGSAGDCFSQHNGAKFSTYDDDNDDALNKSCAFTKHAGWWYKDCYWCNLNGKHFKVEQTHHSTGITWCLIDNYKSSMEAVEMMIRPKK